MLTISLTASILLPLVLYIYGLFKWVDLLFRIFLAEFNRSRNKRRVEDFQSSNNGNESKLRVMGQIVGYREDPQLFENSLVSLVNTGCGCLVVGIDGNEKEDLKMVNVFQKVGTLKYSLLTRLTVPHRYLISPRRKSCISLIPLAEIS